MILEALLSFFTVLVTAVLCLFTSGGTLYCVYSQWPLLAGIVLILSVMLYLSGYGKFFLKIFYSSSKLQKLSLSDLRKIENGLSFAINSLFYISLFFLVISGIYFYLNFSETQTLGFNLAAVLFSLFVLAFFEMIFFVLKGNIKNRIIICMAEEDTVPNSAKVTGKKCFTAVLKIIISIAIIILFYIFAISSTIVNHSHEEPLSFYYMRDIPGIIYTFVPSALLLAISGIFKTFCKALKYLFVGQKISVSQKALSINAVHTVRWISLFEGLMCSTCGFLGMLFNLEDKSALGICMAVANIPLFYSLFINLILLPVESKISLLANAD